MTFGRHSLRWTLWVFAAALLLKSAMPFLASASAQMQERALAEVCSIYGVSWQPNSGAGHETPGDHAPGDSSEHCALTALAAQAAAEPRMPAAIPVAAGTLATLHAHASSSAPDACATWIAQLRHGPPRFA